MHMLAITSRMVPRALLGVPVGMMGISNVATSGKGRDWGMSMAAVFGT